MKDEVYASTFLKNEIPSTTLGALIKSCQNDKTEEDWRRKKANRLAKIFLPVHNVKINALSEKQVDGFSKTCSEKDWKGIVGTLRYLIKKEAGETLQKNGPKNNYVPLNTDENIAVKKIKHFTIDDNEVKELLSIRNSRFSELLVDIKEQLLVLEPGKSHGFIPPTKDVKEIKAIEHAVNEMGLKMGFKTRYIKAKNAIVLIREEALKGDKNGK